MTRWKKWLLGASAAVVLIASAAGLWTYSVLSRSYQGFKSGLLLQVERGSGTRDIARQLAQAGVIEQEWPFLAARALHRGATLQAGEYQFNQPASVLEVFDRLVRGDIYFFDFTVPEGSNIWDIARLLESEGIFSEADFLAAAADPSPIRDLDPEAQSLEGYLFPSTYRLTHATTATDLCRMMVDEFRRQWQQLPAGGSARSPHEAVTLASLVEKETGVAEERELVAGVFANRLEQGMPLACDPTVIYAALLENKYRGKIYRSDLDRDHPYNTYRHPGLPPGPIANPGAASLRAALDPAETPYLFFVARPDGRGHVFSETSAAHERAVRAYRNGGG